MGTLASQIGMLELLTYCLCQVFVIGSPQGMCVVIMPALSLLCQLSGTLCSAIVLLLLSVERNASNCGCCMTYLVPTSPALPGPSA